MSGTRLRRARSLVSRAAPQFTGRQGIGCHRGVIALSIFLLVHYNRPHPADTFRIVPFTYYPGYQEDPAISPDGKEIAFVSQGKDGDDPFEVYVQLIGTTDPLRLTNVPAGYADRSPVWNPSATRIAFLRTRTDERFARILTISALGGAETDLGMGKVISTGRLAWSPEWAHTGIRPFGS